MDETPPDILVLDQKIDPADLARLAASFFEDMVKYVVDIRTGRAAAIRERVRELTFRMIGEGEPLP